MVAKQSRPNLVTQIVAVTLAALMVSALGAAPAAAQETPTVENDEIAIDGSEITIKTGGAASIAVSELPNGSEIADTGDFAETRDGLLASNLATGLPETVSFTLVPPADSNGTISFVVDGSTVELQVVNRTATPVVETGEITAGGAEIVINASGAGSVAVTELPAGSEVTDTGEFARTDSGLLASNLSTGLSDSISFTLTPPEGSVNGSIEFIVGGEQVTVMVVAVPSDVPDGVNDKQYTAVYENNERPNTLEISQKVNEWFSTNDNTIDGTEFGTQEISKMISYWYSQ